MIQVDIVGPRTGAENMRSDIQSATECLRGRSHPHLRLYTWQPAAVSLGAHQTPDLVDRSITSIHGVDVVIRPTGGGAILHTDEVTYCITLPLGERSPTNVYAIITEALLSGLRGLGIDADPETWPSSFAPGGTYVPEPVCFSGIARNEIRVRGRKLVGSAQRIYRAEIGDRVILQHGSILMSDAHALLPVYLNARGRGTALHQVQKLRERSTSVGQECGTRVPAEEVMEAIRKGFEAAPALWLAGAMEDQRQEVIA